MISRKTFIERTGIMLSGFVINGPHAFSLSPKDLESKRPAVADRKFISPAVEETIRKVRSKIANPELACSAPW